MCRWGDIFVIGRYFLQPRFSDSGFSGTVLSFVEEFRFGVGAWWMEVQQVAQVEGEPQPQNPKQPRFTKVSPHNTSEHPECSRLPNLIGKALTALQFRNQGLKVVRPQGLSYLNPRTKASMYLPSARDLLQRQY